VTDRTPHGGERHTPEDLLDALLAGNRNELLDTMTAALDTDAGLRALATLRTSPPAKIENMAGGATGRPAWAIKDETLAITADPYPAIEMIQDLVHGLDQIMTYMPEEGEAACRGCAYALEELKDGLENRALTRSEATALLDVANRDLQELRDVTARPKLEKLAIKLATLWSEQLKILRQAVVRMFDDAYDNISIEN
jgi:hypothetical protein